MSATIWAVFLATISMLTLAILTVRIGPIKRAYYFGITLWSQWLPVLATGLMMAVLAANIAAGGGKVHASLDLEGYFTLGEMIALFLLGPLFLTKIGNVLATATVVYMLQRLLLGDRSFAPVLSVYLVTGSVTLVAILGDKMPWHAPSGGNVAAYRLREILLAVLTVGALGVSLASVVQVHAFTRWLDGTFRFDVPAFLVLLILVGMMIGWMSVALGFTRHFTIPLLSLPTMFAAAFVTGWPSHMLVIPFATCLALSLASADRRVAPQRRRHPVVTTYVALR